MARPKLEINYDLVRELALIQCTQDEISSILHISDVTLRKNKMFLDIYKEAQEQGKKSLRRKQFDVAMTGNTSMLIWLGKQYLGQTDKSDSTITGQQTVVMWSDDFGEKDTSVSSDIAQLRAV